MFDVAMHAKRTGIEFRNQSPVLRSRFWGYHATLPPKRVGSVARHRDILKSGWEGD